MRLKAYFYCFSSKNIPSAKISLPGAQCYQLPDVEHLSDPVLTFVFNRPADFLLPAAAAPSLRAHTCLLVTICPRSCLVQLIQRMLQISLARNDCQSVRDGKPSGSPGRLSLLLPSWQQRSALVAVSCCLVCQESCFPNPTKRRERFAIASLPPRLSRCFLWNLCLKLFLI